MSADEFDVLVSLDAGRRWVRVGPFESEELAEKYEAHYPPGAAVVCRRREDEA